MLVLIEIYRPGGLKSPLSVDAQSTGAAPDIALVRNYSSRPGVAINLEQQITDDLGIFSRASINDGTKEAYEFTEINNSVSIGLSLTGAYWDRPGDIFGLAGVTNGLSQGARVYFAAGGLGILIGDGKLPNYGRENIIETYYSITLAGWIALAIDYQLIINPAYNRNRGPVSVFGTRLHLGF